MATSGAKSKITRNTKKAKKSGRLNNKVVLYVPDTFDPEAHLPEEMRHLADSARYLLHRINVGRVHLRRGNNLVYLKHDYLRAYLHKGTFTMIRDALVDSGVIHVRKFCIAGEMCYGYRLLPPHNEGFHHHRPTDKLLVKKICSARKRKSDSLRDPAHRAMRRFLKAVTIDEAADIASVRVKGFKRAAALSSIRRIVEGDIRAEPDRFGRFHTNVTNLKSSLRPFLRYQGSPLVNLDIANSQPMVFCLLLVNLLSNAGKLGNLIDVEFEENTSNFYMFEIDEEFLSSLPRPSSSSEEFPEEEKEEGWEGGYNGEFPILREKEDKKQHNSLSSRQLRRGEVSQGLPQDVKEFIRLCEGGVLYDELMRRLDIPIRRRKGFKRLFFTQVFFGKVRPKGWVTELFASDFPTVYQAVCDLKRKDHHQMAYLLQAHESKIMIDIIARRILHEMPGTFIATIHDSILTTPDRAETVKTIMREGFRRFGLHPTIRLDS